MTPAEPAAKKADAAPKKPTPAASAAEKKKIDPDDNKAYTFREIEAKYKGDFSAQEVKEYWEEDMTPAAEPAPPPLAARQAEATPARPKAAATPEPPPTTPAK